MLLLSLAESNLELIDQARGLGFETAHIGLPPLNLEGPLRDCVRRIEAEAAK
ncbi:hypothetical protein [Azospirillum picis]|uniref:Sugar phosphate isomerase/epimerase n=1 Tax=Azospirillum picis TaxID=488438 RepID=A0ABU0MSB8_9PROT|nr:hypothetical protein [Azospirillum picis]MBP2300831.1 hypothetical protein [Azospirillum picis]MDQ0536088.1 hypothetical protein [Azospirillum picis]